MSSAPLIAHIVFALDTGGLENGLVNIINRTSTSQLRHMVICLTSSGRFSERIQLRDQVPVIELRKPPGHSLATFWRLWCVLRQYKPDIVHSRNLAALECQWITLLLPGIKRVHSEHGRGVADLHGTNWKNNLLRKLSRPLIHHYVAVSQDLKAWLEKTIGVRPDKVSQIYNGVDFDQFSANDKVHKKLSKTESSFRDPGRSPPQYDEENLVIGTVGRLTAVKDQRLIFEAIAHLKQSGRWCNNIRILIVGGGDLRQELESLADTLELSDITHFTGDRDDVNSLLQLMDIFVLPSLTEGISNTLLEAMASELPVVATRVGGTPEIIEDGQQGFLIPSRNSQALADALYKLIHDKSLRTAMGQRGRTNVEVNFNWENTINFFSALYLNLAADTKIPIPNKSLTNSGISNDQRRST